MVYIPDVINKQMNPNILKRLHKEKAENATPSSHFYIQPIKNNLYEWHFTLLGPEDTDFEGGVYHGKFILPKNYPLNPPDIYFMTPNGRFDTSRKICLNITGYHKEAWTPLWSLRTMTNAICAYLVINEGGIGAMYDSPATRKEYAKKSKGFKCKECGCTDDIEKLIVDARQPVVSDASKQDETETKDAEDKSVKRKKAISKKTAPKKTKAKPNTNKKAVNPKKKATRKRTVKA